MFENDSDSFVKEKKTSENKNKELLYNLFYEIKSEILGTKIEIEEDEYQENIRLITIPNLVKYIHDSIQILIIKKTEDTKKKQREEDDKFYMNKFCGKNKKNKIINLPEDQKLSYENIIKNLESRERQLYKQIFQNKLRTDAMESKIAEYMEMENEFEDMKTKLKFEGGRFLNNDRKDNEIIIIRTENTNLKKVLKKLEEKIQKNKELQLSKDRLINELKEKIKILEKKYKEEAKDKTEIKNNDNNIQSLDDFLKENKDKNNSKERELYKEEKYKIEEYEHKKNEQDELLNEMHVGLIDLKQDAINAGRQIKEMNKKIEEGKRRIDENNNKIKTQIDRIKDLTK